MKHVLIALAALAALAAAAGAVAVAGTAASSVKTLDLSGTVTGSRLVLDARPAGASAGDIGYETGTIAVKGKRVGRFQGICTQLPHSSSQCSFTVGLPDGQLVIEAAYGPGFNTGSVAREAVVGGTGAYAGARGEGVDRELSDTKLAIHLKLR